MKPLLSIVALLFVCGAYSQNCSEANSITSVKKRRAGNTEYVIFTLKNPVTAKHEVTDAKPPFTQDGSGNTVHVKGCKFKQVKFNDVVWTCKIPMTSSGSPYLIRDVNSTGQFEGVISYVIGYRCSATSVVSYDYEDGDKYKFVVRLKR